MREPMFSGGVGAALAVIAWWLHQQGEAQVALGFSVLAVSLVLMSSLPLLQQLLPQRQYLPAPVQKIDPAQHRAQRFLKD